MFLNIENFKEGAPVANQENIRALHPEYAANVSLWQKNRRFATGASEVKKYSKEYIPELDSHKEDGTGELYRVYADRAILHPAVGETIKMYLGLIFQKEPEYLFRQKPFENFKQSDIFLNASQDEENYDTFIQNVTKELLTVGRVGVLEDLSVEDPSAVKTVAQREADKNYSYSVIYQAENIINWGFNYVNGRKQMTFYVLSEKFLDQSSSIMSPVERDRWRVLALIPQQTGVDETGAPIYSGDPVYVQIVIEQNSDGVPIVKSLVEPKKNGKPFYYIPFWVINPTGNKPAEIHTPLFNDLTELSKGHLRNSADYEQELHILAIKTAVFPGMTKERQNEYGPLHLGGAIGCPEGQTPFFLEATPNSAIANEMISKEQKMAIIGSQGLAPKGGRYVQSETTAEIQSSGDASVISTIANTIEQVMSEVLMLKLEWSLNYIGIADVKLKKDYFLSKLTPDMLPNIVAVIQAGGVISKELLFNMMKRMDLIPPEANFKESEIEAEKSFGMLTQAAEKIKELEAKNAQQPAKEPVKAEDK